MECHKDPNHQIPQLLKLLKVPLLRPFTSELALGVHWVAFLRPWAVGRNFWEGNLDIGKWFFS